MVKYFFKRAAMLMALAAVVIASGCNQNVGQKRDGTPLPNRNYHCSGNRNRA